MKQPPNESRGTEIEFKAILRMMPDSAEKSDITPPIFLDISKMPRRTAKNRIGVRNYSHCPVAALHDGAQYWLSAGK